MVRDGEQHAALLRLRNRHLRGGKALEIGLLRRLRKAQRFAGGFHFRPKADLDLRQLFKAEHRHLDRDRRRGRIQARAKAHLRHLLAQRRAHTQLDDRNARDLGNIRHGTGGTRVDFDDVQIARILDELDIHQTAHMQTARDVDRVIRHHALNARRKVLRRIDGDGVAGVNARALDMLHDARDQHVLAVADRVHLDFAAQQILVHQNRMFLHVHVDDGHVFADVLFVICNFHALTAKHIARAHEHRIAQLRRRLGRFVRREDGRALRLRNAQTGQQFVEQFAVFRRVDVTQIRAEDAVTRFAHGLCQLDGRLAAELADHADRLLDFQHVHHVFRRERLEIQAIGGIEVGGNGFRVVVDDDGIKARALERPDAVHRAIVKLDALADADRAGTQHDDGLAAAVLRFGRRAVGAVKIRADGLELAAAGIDHAEGRLHVQAGAKHADIRRLAADKARNGAVRHAHFFGGHHRIRVQRSDAAQRADFLLHADDVLHLFEEPDIDLRNLVDMLHRHAAAKRFRHDEGALGVDAVQPGFQLVVGQRFQRRGHETVLAHLQRAHSLEQRVFEIRADGHDFARRFHLRADVLIGIDEFIKRPAREFEHHVIQRRLGAGVGLPGYAVDDFIERVPKRDAGRDFGNRIARRLGSQRRGTRHARVDLNDVILHAVRAERILHVAAALDAQRADDVQRRAAQHLMFGIAERLARRDDNRIARMYADGVKVLHVADGDAVACAVADDLVFDFLPARNAALDQVFMHAGGAQAVRTDFAKLLLVLRNAAARAAKRVGRTHDNRVAVFVGEIHRALHIVDDDRVDARFADGEHHVFEILAVFGAADGVDLRAQKLHVVFLQNALFVQLHGQIQARLAAQRSQQAVRALARDDLFQ